MYILYTYDSVFRPPPSYSKLCTVFVRQDDDCPSDDKALTRRDVIRALICTSHSSELRFQVRWIKFASSFFLYIFLGLSSSFFCRVIIKFPTETRLWQHPGLMCLSFICNQCACNCLSFSLLLDLLHSLT